MSYHADKLKMGWIFILKLNLTLKVKNYRDLNKGLLRIWSKFGDLSLNGWWVDGGGYCDFILDNSGGGQS